jgi:ABC-type antimicrobial peptide transport system permease subunit
VRAQRTFNLVLFVVGALALAIGGAGIMNILLASVAERTHEIGVRRAVGARARDVLAQFAAEAVLLCLAGAAAGVPAGAALAAAIALVAGWPVALSGGAILLALTLALVVGLAAGPHPARVAARLDPVDALRAG